MTFHIDKVQYNKYNFSICVYIIISVIAVETMCHGQGMQIAIELIVAWKACGL